MLIRCDLNVPLDGDTITDDGRIRAVVPTLKAARATPGAKVIVLAHLGRPKGEAGPEVLAGPRRPRGSVNCWGREVGLASDIVGESAQATVDGLADGEVAMLENVRYEPGEESKDDTERGELADRYAALGDVFVSDGFGVVHRKQASRLRPAARLPNAAGGLVKAEVEVLKRLTEDPQRPYVVVLGGAKVSDKLAVIANLLKTADTLVIGGGMVFTFLAAQGHEVGKSLLEADQIDAVRGYLERGGGDRQADRAAHRHRRGARVHGRRDADRGGRRRHARRPAGPGHRPRLLARLRRGDHRRQDRLLERPDGRREWESFAGGTRAVAQALTEVDGALRGRRRRLRGRRP